MRYSQGELTWALWDLVIEKGRASSVLPGGLTVIHYEQERAFRVGREGVAPGADEVKAVQECMYTLWGTVAAVVVADVEEMKGWMVVRLEWIGRELTIVSGGSDE